MAHKWALWLHHPCRPGGPQRFKAGDKIRSAHKWAAWLHHPYCLRGPQRFKAGDRINSGPQVDIHHSRRPGVPNTSEQRTKSKVAHMWTNWLHHPW